LLNMMRIYSKKRITKYPVGLVWFVSAGIIL